MTILFLLSIAAAMSLFYLSLNHQRWRAQVLPKKLRLLAALLLVAGLWFGSQVFSLGTCLLAVSVISMCLCSLFPFLSLFKTTNLISAQNKNPLKTPALAMPPLKSGEQNGQ